MKFYFLDIETNSESLEFNKNDHEIIQIGIYNSDTKEKFTRNINIGKPLSENIKRLTGISDDDLISGIDLKTALNDAITFLGDVKDSVIVGHNLEDFDLYILGKNDSRFLNYNYIDTLHLFLFLFPGFSSYSVQELYKKFIKSEYLEKHQALQDSIDEFELFSKVLNVNFLKKYYQQNGKDLSFLKNLLKKYDGGLNTHCYNYKYLETILSDIEIDDYVLVKSKMLDKWFYNYQQQYLKVIKENEGKLNSEIVKITSEGMKNLYEEFINKTNNSFRDAQYQMSQHIKDVLNRDNANLFIEAGTGTGKTYSYLLPSIEFISKNKGNKRIRIFISTYTKVLQNQIMEKDIPFLNSYYPNVRFELLKATSEGIALDNVPYKGQLLFWDLILWNWLYWGNFYLSDIHFSLQKKIGVSKLESYTPGNFEDQSLDTNFGFRGKLKYQLATGDIFIINHAFMITKFNYFNKDKYTGITSFKEYPSIDNSAYFIIDEGHNLESVIRDYLTLDYTKNQFDKVLSFFNPSSNFNIVNYINRFIERSKSKLDKIVNKKIIDEIKLEISDLNYNLSNERNLLKGLTDINKINEINEKIKMLTEKIQENEADLERYTNSTEILEEKSRIEKLEKIKKFYSARFESEENKNMFKIYNKYLSDFKDTKLYDLAVEDINRLREQGYDTSTVEYDKEVFNNLYLSDWLNNFLSYSFQVVEKLYYESLKITGSDFGLETFLKYFNIGLILTSNHIDKNYFFNSIVELSESGNDLKNFGFRGVPLDLSSGSQFLKESNGNIVLSATLFDKGSESYVLREVFGNSYNFAKIKKYPTPFDYKRQRRIYSVKSSDSNIIEHKMNEFIQKYGGRTLILTSTLAQKRRLAKFCKDKYEKQGIMVLMHRSGTLSSSTNQKNVQCLRDNPNTILIGSKSYAEGVDVPGDNLKLVIIDKLPFLPPTPFIKFQDKKWRSKGDRYVYKFLCSIDFRQAIGRLIRTKNDSGDILILDERILLPSGQFFNDYLVGENINEI